MTTRTVRGLVARRARVTALAGAASVAPDGDAGLVHAIVVVEAKRSWRSRRAVARAARRAAQAAAVGAVDVRVARGVDVHALEHVAEIAVARDLAVHASQTAPLGAARDIGRRKRVALAAHADARAAAIAPIERESERAAAHERRGRDGGSAAYPRSPSVPGAPAGARIGPNARIARSCRGSIAARDAEQQRRHQGGDRRHAPNGAPIQHTSSHQPLYTYGSARRVCSPRAPFGRNLRGTRALLSEEDRLPPRRAGDVATARLGACQAGAPAARQSLG